ncbi:MAG: hypothetical protein ACTJHU_01440 [Mycetocola sp.]
MSATIEQRCEALRSHVTDIIGLSVSAEVEPGNFGLIIGHLNSIASLQGEDNAELPAEFRHWLSVSDAVLGDIRRAAEAGDSRVLWSAITDPSNGLYHLGDACRAQPGWGSPAV